MQKEFNWIEYGYKCLIGYSYAHLEALWCWYVSKSVEHCITAASYTWDINCVASTNEANLLNVGKHLLHYPAEVLAITKSQTC